MRIDKDRKLFFGCRLDSALREALGMVPAHERHYFEAKSEETPYLRILRVANEQWIGKIVDGGVGTVEVEDLQRNVLSILRRLCPDVRVAPSGIRIFSITDEPAVDVIDDSPSTDDLDLSDTRASTW